MFLPFINLPASSSRVDSYVEPRQIAVIETVSSSETFEHDLYFGLQSHSRLCIM